MFLEIWMIVVMGFWWILSIHHIRGKSYEDGSRDTLDLLVHHRILTVDPQGAIVQLKGIDINENIDEN